MVNKYRLQKYNFILIEYLILTNILKNNTFCNKKNT